MTLDFTSVLSLFLLHVKRLFIVLTFLYAIFVFLLLLVSILESFSDSVFIYGKEKYLVVVTTIVDYCANVRYSVITLGIFPFVWSAVTSVLFEHISLLFSVILFICLFVCCFLLIKCKLIYGVSIF